MVDKKRKQESQKRYREKNKEKIKEYRDAYFKENREKINDRKRASYELNKEVNLKKYATWRMENPNLVASYRKKWWDGNPEKKKASAKINNAIRDGKLLKQACEVCGNVKADAHHDDYDKPLEVRWLCRKHHKEHHRLLKTAI